MKIIYHSSVSLNTHRFAQKLAVPSLRLPLRAAEDPVTADEPFILILPTYGGGSRRGADIPKQAIRFLNVLENRELLTGVVAAGNTNFGADYCKAGELVSEKCNVPLLYRFELLGMSQDVDAVNSLIEMI